MQKLELDEFKKLSPKSVIVDLRKPEVFADGFIEKSVSIPLNEDFVAGMSEIVGEEPEILVIAEKADLVAAVNQVKASGIGNVLGFLNGGFETWKDAGGKIDLLIAIDADEFAMDYQFDEFYLLDVRPKEEFEAEHVEEAENIPLIDLQELIAELEVGDSYYVYAKTVAEATTASSLLKRYGFNRVRTVAADFEQIKETGMPFYVKKKERKKTDENSW